MHYNYRQDLHKSYLLSAMQSFYGGIGVSISDDSENDSRRFKIINRYCRLTTRDRFARCSPQKHEQDRGLQNKVIYETEEDALACACELELMIGSMPLYPYLCERSTNGHWHLTSKIQTPRQIQMYRFLYKKRQAAKQERKRLRRIKMEGHSIVDNE